MRAINKLTVAKINALSKRGDYCDGNNLYLQVSESISKRHSATPRGATTQIRGTLNGRGASGLV